MISKSQLKTIIFIKNHIIEKDQFINELFKQIELYAKDKLSKEKFNDWLDSWEATAELDCDPEASKRIKKAFKNIRSKETSPENWKKFKESLGLH